MARVLNEGDEIRIVIETEDEPFPVLILKMPNDKAVEEFETNRVKIEFGRHGKTKTVIEHERDIRFVDDHLLSCENIDIRLSGEFVSLDPSQHPDWKGRIPSRWKRRAASYFLPGEAREESEKNS